MQLEPTDKAVAPFNRPCGATSRPKDGAFPLPVRIGGSPAAGVESFYGSSFVCCFKIRVSSDHLIRTPMLAGWFRFVLSPVTVEPAELPRQEE